VDFVHRATTLASQHPPHKIKLRFCISQFPLRSAANCIKNNCNGMDAKYECVYIRSQLNFLSHFNVTQRECGRAYRNASLILRPSVQTNQCFKQHTRWQSLLQSWREKRTKQVSACRCRENWTNYTPAQCLLVASAPTFAAPHPTILYFRTINANAAFKVAVTLIALLFTLLVMCKNGQKCQFFGQNSSNFFQ
jgi:hypothetical protein